GIHFLVSKKSAALITDFDHANGLVGAVVKAGFAPDACGWVNHDFATESSAMNRASWATDHAHRIDTMHTGIGNHDSSVGRPVAQEARIIIMSSGAGADTIVTTR